MMNRLLRSRFLLLAVGAIIIFGIAFLFLRKVRTESSGVTRSGEVVIEMTEDGFVPDTVRITRGTTVRFINRDNLGHWPASDLHPSHTIYPEFDPKKPIPPGEEWSFTFDQIGEWGMHDHLSPYIEGTIIVVE